MSSIVQVSVPRLSQERPTVASMAEMALALFDELEFGLIACDEWGTIHLANRAAQQEMASQRLLLRSDNTLRGAQGTSGDIGAALRQAGQRGRRSLLRLTRAGDQLMVSFMPLQTQGVDTRQVLVMLGRRQPFSDLAIELLASIYGLTLAERRVLGALVRLATPSEIASAHAVKVSTVRTQITSIRAKFGARSIDGLLLRIAQMPPMATALRLAGASCASTCTAPLLAAA